MMTKEEHINHWLKTSENDLKTMNILFKEGSYTHSLFFGHLYLEKVCKALWVKHSNENIAPYTHNLTRLLEGIETDLSEDDLDFLVELNDYQLEGRYPEFTERLYKKTTKEITERYISKIKMIDECLRRKL